MTVSDVAVVGGAMTRFGETVDAGIKELFAEAYHRALQSVDKGIDPGDIQAAFIGTVGSGGAQLGQPAPLLMGFVGLPHVPAYRLENACASGGFALLAGIHAIVSGQCDVCLVAGVEKMQDLPPSRARYWLGVSGDTEYERLAGLTFAGIYALVAQRYLHDYGLSHEALAHVAVKNHAHGQHNRYAHLRRAITLEQALRAPEVANPLRLYDCCPASDGAAVVILASKARARAFTDRPVYITGWGAGTDYLALHDRPTVTSFRATRQAAAQAFQRAGRTPKDVRFAEVHDCFTIAELLAYEDLGFCEPGQGWRLVREGVTGIDGPLPVNASGGLKSKGHPLGATGVAMAVEILSQMQGRVEPERQVRRPDVGLLHNVGGSGGSCVVCLFEQGS